MDIDEFLRQSAHELNRKTYSDTPGRGIASDKDRLNDWHSRYVAPNTDAITPEKNQGQIYALERLARMHPQERQSLLDFMYRHRLNQMDKDLTGERMGWATWPQQQQIENNKRLTPGSAWNTPYEKGMGWRM